MSEVVIRAEGLGKKYLIGHQTSHERYVALRDVVARSAKGFARSARDMLRGRQLVAGNEVEEFWALKDVSFEIRRGDVVGVIGRNGAGKSTLLKILSRITEPTEGWVEIRGRVASLLEVGTGFHPELTGRENVYLNGAILGMSRAEIQRKFDEIVAFAEVEKFLDTPVKRYSSGMYVRLAFAVAAHLEPEILVVDEVLAVGDAEFQKKCLGKMGEVAGQGRTVLFVSHNFDALNTICRDGILLNLGRMVGAGGILDVVSAYNKLQIEFDSAAGRRSLFAGPLMDIVFTKVSVNDSLGAAAGIVPSDQELTITLAGYAKAPISNFRFSISVFCKGTRILTIQDGPSPVPPGDFEVRLALDKEFLRPGDYTIAAGGRRVDGDDWIWGTDLVAFQVVGKWNSVYDSENIGIVNLNRRIQRVYAP